MLISQQFNLHILNKWDHVYKELDKYFHFSTNEAGKILKKFKKSRLIYERDYHKVYHVVIDNEDFVFKIKPDSASSGVDYHEKLVIVDEMLKQSLPTADVIYLKDDPNNYESHSLEFYVSEDLSKINLTPDVITQLINQITSLHEHNIIHGDLRLENILLEFNENSRDMNFVFIDFETFTKTDSIYAKQYDLLRLYYSLKKHGYEVNKEDFIKFKMRNDYFKLIDEKARKYV